MDNHNDNMCPVCGYTHLPDPAYDDALVASFEICPCCGTQFGYDDAITPYSHLREKWIHAGSPWTSESIAPPEGWDASKQLANAGLV